MKKLKSNADSVGHKSTTCDNHVVANSISEETCLVLQDLEFSEKNVTGGDPRVRMERLWSKKASTLEDADDCFGKGQFHIKHDKSFVGYIEEEIATLDEPISYLPLNETAWDSLLPKLSPRPCPKGIHKGCDIHLALHKRHPYIERTLLESGFYYLELEKPHLSKVRIFTMQTQALKAGNYNLDKSKTRCSVAVIGNFNARQPSRSTLH